MKIIIFASLFAFINACNKNAYKETIKEEFEIWKNLYGKKYDSECEERFRLEIFLENKMKIAKHNEAAHNGLHSYFLSTNQFADLLSHEFAAKMNGCQKSVTNRTFASTFLPPENLEIPSSVDWRKQGYVTPVKDQGQIGASWAFSATGSLEGQHFKKTKTLVSLSEQNLVDCIQQGAQVKDAFDYVISNNGIDTEAGYKYKGGVCNFNRATVGATCIGYVNIASGREDQLTQAVATIGPVSVAIDASHESFQFYAKGVYNEPECSTQNLDHAVLVVGYGVTSDGIDYWIVKNSWGADWGDGGYILMSRNKGNQCGIATDAIYPLV